MLVAVHGFTHLPCGCNVTSRHDIQSRSAPDKHPAPGGWIMRSLNTPIVVSWALQIVVAVILLQTLFFKFTGAAESVHIFSTLGAEPWGRIGSGVVELIAALLLLYPPTITIGAIVSLGVISG